MQVKIFVAILIWNIVVFSIYGYDKWKAKHNEWRISEKTLILSAFFMGSIGGIMGMIMFHHKTKHMKFLLLLPLALVFNIGVIYFAKRHLQAF